MVVQAARDLWVVPGVRTGAKEAVETAEEARARGGEEGPRAGQAAADDSEEGMAAAMEGEDLHSSHGSRN